MGSVSLRRFILGMALCLAIVGGAAAATIPSDKVKGFTKGHTTKAEVLASLGPPDKQSGTPDGGSVLLYNYTSPQNDQSKPPNDLIVVCVFSPGGAYQGIQVYAKNDNAAGKPAAAPPAGAGQPMSALRDENVLTPLPAGFGIGAQGDNGPLHTAELIPAGETVNAWSRMITQQTIHGRRSEDPSKWPTQLAAGWKQACPGGAAEALSKDTVNGYPATLWRFTCPLNPATHKAEAMWMRVISGGDALYAVQYAYRRALSDDMEPEATAYLKTVKVCDTRGDVHPCPH